VIATRAIGPPRYGRFVPCAPLDLAASVETIDFGLEVYRNESLRFCIFLPFFPSDRMFDGHSPGSLAS